MKLVMDTHEKDSRKDNIKKFISMSDITVEEGTLPVADYVAYTDDGRHLFEVEWKSVPDFISSINSKHMKSQLIDMEQLHRPYLFIVGDWKTTLKELRARKLKFSRDQEIGFIVSASARYKTKIIVFDTEKEAIHAFLKLFTVHANDIGFEIIPERHTRTGDPNLDMYLAIPGIGPKKATEYNKVMSFYVFISKCMEYDTPTKFKKDYGVSVPKSVVDYVRKLHRV